MTEISILEPNDGEGLSEGVNLEINDSGQTSLNYLVNVSKNGLEYPLILNIVVTGKPVYDIPVYININLLENYYEISDPLLKISETKNDQQTTSNSSVELSYFLNFSWVLLPYPFVKKIRKNA